METAEVVRKVLIVDMVGMALLALVYLRQRRMNMQSLIGWSLLALLVPVLGPFLVITNRPGEWDPEFSLKVEVHQLRLFARRVLPIPTNQKLSRLERARLRRSQKQKK